MAITLVSCRTPTAEEQLEGSWHSNREETVARWKHEGVLPDKTIEALEKDVLGKMTVTYADGKVTSTTGEWTEVEPYQVVESGKDYVIIDQFSKEYKRNLRLRVQFVKDGYWVSNDEIIKGYVEKFDRLKR
jgi:hypothetical protein